MIRPLRCNCPYFALQLVQVQSGRMQVTSTDWGQTLINDPEQLVTQVFCSACPVAYNYSQTGLWQPISSIILEAAYEGTLRAAALSAHKHAGKAGAKRVYLTLLGGGAFGNPTSWITAAIDAALRKCEHFDLDVKLVMFSRDLPTDHEVEQLLERWSARCGTK